MFKKNILIIFYIFFVTSKIFSYQGISELRILKDDLSKNILNYKYKFFISEKTGALGCNVLYEQGKRADWNISHQKNLDIFIVKGIIEMNTDLIEYGLKAMEYGLAHQLRDGTFPNSSYYDTEQFVSSALHAVLILKQSQYSYHYTFAINLLIQKLSISIFWLKDNFNQNILPEIHSNNNFSSNLLGNSALCFFLGGKELKDSFLQQQAKDLIEILLKTQRSDGVFLDKNGYDSYYQACTLKSLMIYFLYSDEDITFNQKIYAALKSGWEWQISRIKNNGTIIMLGNTRSGKKSQNDIFIFDDNIYYPDIATAFLYWGYITQSDSFFLVSKKVFMYGTANHPIDSQVFFLK